MTVTYTAEVANSSFGCFLRLLIRWRGSVYKLVWKEFSIFVIAYYTLNFVYRFALNGGQRMIFEKVVAYCDMYNNLIPVAFVLGFYVSIVVTRWWDQFLMIPWPDRMAMFVTANIHGQDDRARLMRRTIMRYLCLAYVITMSSISPVVKKRFPSWSHMTEAGFMLPNEEKILESLQTPHNKYFVPLAWATALLTRCRKENRIRDDHAVKTLVDEVNAFRGMLGTLFNYDWVSIPLVYTQVVTLAVYTFFLSCLMGRQFIEDGLTLDMYLPVFTFLQFFFYMGWLKVAETLVNPFGEDDDDFDINAVIDRNLQVSYLVVDEMHSEHPELIKDQYWDEVEFDLPYTAATIPSKEPEVFLGSAMNIAVTPRDAQFMPMESIAEKDELRRVSATKPTDIPRIGFVPKLDLAKSDSKSNRGFRNLPGFIKRSTSRQSQKPSPNAAFTTQESVLSSTGTIMGERKNHIYSQEDIFQMSDLESQAADKQSTADLWSQISVATSRRAESLSNFHKSENNVHEVTSNKVSDAAPTSDSGQSADTVKSVHDTTLVGTPRGQAPVQVHDVDVKLPEPSHDLDSDSYVDVVDQGHVRGSKTSLVKLRPDVDHNSSNVPLLGK